MSHSKYFKEYLQKSLTETFETDTSERTDTDTSYDIPNMRFERLKKLRKSMGKTSGSFGYVSPDDTDDTMVVKQPHEPEENLKKDGYFTYIKYIVDHKLAQQNPYFPRVYRFEFDKNKQGQEYYKIQLEKLINLKELDSTEIIQLGLRTFKGFQKHVELYQKHEGSIIEAFVAMLIECTQYSKLSLANDQELVEAIKIISNIIDNNSNQKFFWDISQYNVMARRTQLGLQLVFVDPMA